MKQHREHMDKVFREKLNAYSQQPPEEVWKGISGKLSSTARRKGLFIWLAAAAGLTALAGALLLVSREPAGDVLLQQEVTEEVSPEWNKDQPSVQEKPEVDGQPQVIDRDLHPKLGPGSPDEGKESTGPYLTAAEQQKDTEKNILDRSVYLAAIPGQSSEGFSTGFDPEKASQPYLDDKQYEPVQVPVQESEGYDAAELRKTGSTKKWSVGSQAAPLYAYRNLQKGSTDAATIATDANSLNNNESGILSYSGGINVQYHTSRRLTLQSGIYYSRMGMQIDFEGVAAKYDFALPNYGIERLANSTGTLSYDAQAPSNTELANSWNEYNRQVTGGIDHVDGSSEALPSSWDLLQYLDYFEIPLVLKFKLIDQKIDLSLFSGLSSQILVGNDVYLQEGSQREKVGETENIRSFNYSSILGLGLDYPLGKGWVLNLEPSFKYYLNSVNTTDTYRSYPWNFGIFTGISYTIR